MIPLNVFSNYSLLKSALTIDEYLDEVSKRKITSAGLCDPDYVFGFPYFASKALKKGIKPILGVRLKIEETELVFFIKNDEGYKALLELFEILNSEEFDVKTLNKYTQNLITVIPTRNIVYNNISTSDFRDYFKKWALLTSDFFIGLDDVSTSFCSKLRDFCEEFNYSIVAFPHIKYLTKDDAKTFAMIEAVRDGKTLELNTHFKGNQYYLSDAELSQNYLEKEIKNTALISETCHFNLTKKYSFQLPLPPHIKGNPSHVLKEKLLTALTKLNLDQNETYVNRLNNELAIIEMLKFTNYFLVVSDYVNYARSQNILVGYGRGSAPGSLVSYLLGITFVDPIKYNLLFERFLNPARISMPDIDIDFMDTRRHEVINYIRETYGDDHVAQIVTFQTNAAKASIRDTGRIFNIDTKFIGRLSNSFPNQYTSLRDAYIKVPSFKKLIDEDKYNLEIIQHAVKLEGFPRQTGIHAAGVIINAKPLSENLPTFRANGIRITQYEMDFLEANGFLKVDILGLTNLTFIQRIIDHVNQKETTPLDFYKLTFDDPKLYMVIRDGHTLGLFQLESEGMRKAINIVKPSSFEDVCALLALYRPGPMAYIDQYAKAKANLIKIDYLDKTLESILSPTYGIIIYQEQIMEIAVKMAGYSLAEADLMRRAIGKKNEAVLKEQEKHFIDGALRNGYKKTDAQKVFDDILKFAQYGFNKSHSVVYAMTTMALAYLKTNYPLEFYCELLNNSFNDTSKFHKIQTELKEYNIKLLLPSILYSQNEFSILDTNIIIPFSAIIGISHDIGEKIINLRHENSFTSLEDFYFRSYNAGLKKDHFIALIESGALDSFDSNRALLKKKLESYLPTLEIGLFSDEKALEAIIVDDISENAKERLVNEINRLRFPISSTPFDNLKIDNAERIRNILEKESVNVRTFGQLNSLKVIRTKTEAEMAFASLNDFDSTVRLVIFPRVYEEYKTIISDKKNFIISGLIEMKDGVQQLIVNTITRLLDD